MAYRILVTGSANWTDPAAIHGAVRKAALGAVRAGVADIVVVHGGAVGADRMGGTAARALGLDEEIHRPDWARYGRAAGPIRSGVMVKLGAHVCLAFILDQSPGATHCANIAERAGIPVIRDERRSDPEFDRLIDESSLGTPPARAIQALTPPDVIEALWTRLGEPPEVPPQ